MATTKVVTGKVTRPDGSNAAFPIVKAALSQPCTIPGTQEIIPVTITAVSAIDGTYTISLYANADLTPLGTYYTITEQTGIDYYSYIVVVPNTAGPFVMTSIATGTPPNTVYNGHVDSLIVDNAATFTNGPLSFPVGSIPSAAVAGAFGAGSDAVVHSLTVKSTGPYAAVLGDGATATPAGVTTGKIRDQGGQVYNVDAFGARADKRTVTDAAILTATATLTSATAAFVNAAVTAGGDVGKIVEVVGAGVAAATLITTILSVQSATSVTLAANAGTTVSGAICDIATDDRAAVVLALTAMGTAPGVLRFPSHRYTVGSTIQSNLQGVTVQGNARTIGGTPGTIIEFAGTGPMFDIGTDNGQAYDGNYYDGPESWSFRDVMFSTARPETALANGLGFYRTGTIAVRDWRGGSQMWENVNVQQFDYPFWGIQSDVNRWENVEVQYCHSGVYCGPRSDQFTFETCYWIWNDRALDIDRSTPRFKNCQWVDNGAVGTNPIKLHTAWANGQWGAVFEDPWFEQYLGVAADLEAFIEIGVGDTVQSSELHIIRPMILTNGSGSIHMKYLVKIGNGTNVQIDEPTAQIFTSGAPGTAANIDALVSCVATNSPDILIRVPNAYAQTNMAKVVSSGGATPNVIVESWGGTSGHSITSGLFRVGSDTLAVDPQIVIDSAVGRNRNLTWQTGGVARWIMRVDNTAEGGSDAGSFWSLIARTDAGASKFTALGISRTSGAANFNSKIYPGTDANAAQSAIGIYAGTGVPNNANGSNGDVYFRSDGGAGTTIYQRRAGAWVATGA